MRVLPLERIWGGGRDNPSVRDNMSESHLTSNTTKSTESTPTNGITESSKSPQDEAIGHIFICPVASSLSRLKGLEEFEGDFITLDSHTSKADFRRFYTQEYFKACDYCHDIWETKRYTDCDTDEGSATTCQARIQNGDHDWT